MSKNWHPPYSEEFKARMVEWTRGRTRTTGADIGPTWQPRHCNAARVLRPRTAPDEATVAFSGTARGGAPP